MAQRRTRIFGGINPKNQGVQMVNRQAYPLWRVTTPAPVDAETLRDAEALVASCENCTPDDAEFAFDYVLDSLTGCDPEATDYVLNEPAHCPNCGHEIQPGHWRWQEDDEGRTVFICPGTLIRLIR